MSQPFNHMPHMNSAHQMSLPSHDDETYMLLPSQASAHLPVVPTQFPNVYTTQPTSVFDGPVVVMPVAHYLGLLGVSGTSPVGAPTTLPAAAPHQYSTASAHLGAVFAAESRAAQSIRRPDAEPATPVDDSTTPPSSRRKVNIACNNCHESRKPCNTSRPCQRCIKRGLSSSCVNHRRKRRVQSVRTIASSNVATASSTASSLNVSIPRPAVQQHVPLGSSSMLSFPTTFDSSSSSSSSRPFSSSTAHESVFDSSYFYTTQ